MRAPSLVSVVFMITALGVAGSARAGTTYWTDDHGFWDEPGNWSNGVPESDDDAFINNGGNAQIRYGAECDWLCLGYASGQSGTVQMSADAGVSQFWTQSIGYGGTGTFVQSGGLNDVYWDVSLAEGDDASSGTYSITGGWLKAKYLNVGWVGSGWLQVNHSDAQIELSSGLYFGSDSRLTAVSGSTIHMVGGAAALGCAVQNWNTDPYDLSGLSNLAIVIENGYPVSTYEVASAIDGGFAGNFSLGELTIGGTDAGNTLLVDSVDNGRRGAEGNECLYTHSLMINNGSTINLGGFGLYVEGDVEAQLDGWIADGRLFDSTLPMLDAVYDPTGGWTVVVPEPATSWLLILGAAPLLRRKRQ